MEKPEELVLESYDLLEGLLHVRVVEIKSRPLYIVEEEKPFDKERKMLESIIGEFRRQNMKGIHEDFNEFSMKNEKYRNLDSRGLYFLDRYFLGNGIVQPLMMDPRIEDISCDGVNIPVFVFLKEYGYLPTNISFNTEDSLNFFIRKIVQDGGKQISVSAPVSETTLKDGSRVSASLGRYVTTRGPSFSIRKFREIPISSIDLMALGTADSLQLAYLWTIIEYGSNVMIVGGTATGKTTFLNAILSFVSSDKKIVTIEDTRELNLKHENWISTVTRTSSAGSDNERSELVNIDMFDLLESALRHRPNYIVVGEVRGAETFTVFQAMLAGRFGMGTFHADDMETFVHRLEARPISIPRTLITSLNTVVILNTVFKEGRLHRSVKEISEIMNVDQGTGELIINSLHENLMMMTSPEGFESHVFRLISAREGVPYEELVDQMMRRKRFLERLEELNITDFDSTISYFAMYKANESRALKSVGLH